MVFRFAAFFAFIAVARGGAVTTPVVAAPLAAAAPVAVAAKLVDSEFDPNPQYTFAYDVQDAITGDSKGQVESRNGDVVQGQYRVVDPDGTLRTVNYAADPINGFNAVVSKTPVGVAVAPARIAAAPVSTYISAPIPARVAAPLVAAPVAYAPPAPTYISAPVAARVAAPLVTASVAYTSPTFAYSSPLAYNVPAPAKVVI